MQHQFDPLGVNLKGINLIEASAGTGKTWNIAALFVRLVLLEQFGVEQILVVTFTQAATAELKTRLYDRLEEVLMLLEDEEVLAQPTCEQQLDVIQKRCGESDAFVLNLLKRAFEKESLSRLSLRLRAALSNFDRASIYTIHGFCHKVLSEFAVYCHTPLAIELDNTKASNQQILLAQDFWRKRVVPNYALAKLVSERKKTPHECLNQLKNFIARPYLQWNPVDLRGDWAELETLLQQKWMVLRANLDEFEQAFWHLFPNLRKNSFKEQEWQERFHDLKMLPENDWIAAKNLLLKKDKDKLFSYLSREYLKSRTLTGRVLDGEKLDKISILGEWGEQCVVYEQQQSLALVQLNLDLLLYLRQENELVKKTTPARQFDDILLDVYHALQPNQFYAKELARAMSETWKVALIDEFQDTDPLQYGIFQAAFVDNQTPLFLVGDPKQAIYGFRGADIFAYLQAVDDARASGNPVMTLMVNRRSHRSLVEAVNALFSREAPFVLPKIEYPKVGAYREESLLKMGENVAKAMAIRWLSQSKETVDVLRTRAVEWCAREIAGMLSGLNPCTIKDKSIEAHQIAVLVQQRKDGLSVQRELKKYGIQSIILSQNSVFASEEAKMVMAILKYFCDPKELALLRFILGSSLFDYSADDIHHLNENESGVLYWVDVAERGRQIWQKHGVYAALNQFLIKEKIESRLLTQNNERALTNLNQLLELLAIEDERSHTPISLIHWLDGKIATAQEEKNKDDDHTLRLESDEELVKIVTMHSSKGLQYPVVFCPFIWDKNTRIDEWSVVHRDSETLLLNKLQLDEITTECLHREQLSESLRLFYVALTRAEERLVLYMTTSLGVQHPFNYLLNIDKETLKNTSDYLNAWRQFVDKYPELMEWIDGDDDLPKEVMIDSFKKSTDFQAASFAPRRFELLKQSSFTGLLRQHEQSTIQTDEMQPALDLAEHQLVSAEPVRETDDLNSLFYFPAGSKGGVCLHDVLEKINFSQAASVQTEYLCHILQKHQLDSEQWLPAIENMVECVRHTPVLPNMLLSQLTAQEMVSEMEFLIHTELFSLKQLKHWFTRETLNLPDVIVRASQNLNFNDIKGFLNGFIDLVCYTADKQILVIDYKSNHLGHHMSDYTPKAMNQAMAQHHYYLQALIYAIAVARYFKQRQVEVECINVAYLFLRGLDGISTHGVWQWRIALADLEMWLD